MAKKISRADVRCREAHVEVLRKVSEKRLARLALGARKKLAKTEETLKKYRGRIKKIQADRHVVEAFLEDVTLVRLEKAGRDIERGTKALEDAKKFGPGFFDQRITI